MNRKQRLTLFAAAALAALALLALSWHLRSWGGVALLVLLGGGFAWYRVQAAHGAEGDQFFEAGEDTRLTAFQGGSPSEMPADPGTRPAGLAPEDKAH